MNCAGCGHVLRSFEYAQPMQVFGRRVRPASMCDACCKANLTAPGSADALERLARGQVDAAAQSRVAELTAQWRAPFADVLSAQRPQPPANGHNQGTTNPQAQHADALDHDADAWPSRMAYEPALDSELEP